MLSYNWKVEHQLIDKSKHLCCYRANKYQSTSSYVLLKLDKLNKLACDKQGVFSLGSKQDEWVGTLIVPVGRLIEFLGVSEYVKA